MLRHGLKTVNSRFLSHSFPFIIHHHPTIGPFTAYVVDEVSLSTRSFYQHITQQIVFGITNCVIRMLLYTDENER
jgi:hypothetical protein